MIKKTNAFTLIELLITTVIFAVVVVSLYSAFHAGILSYNRLDSVFNVFQASRMAFNRLELDLRNAFIYSDTDSKFKGTAQALDFFSICDTYDKDKSYRNVSRMKYELSGNILKRTNLSGLSALDDMADSEPDEMADIKEISFKYAFADGNSDNPYSWQDLWPMLVNQKEILPAAVIIRLSVIQRDKNNNELGVSEFKKIISIPLGCQK